MKKPTHKPKAQQQDTRSTCPIACTLDVLGDKWTLLIIRDLFFGKTTYGQFLASNEGIPTNILAERLKRLVNAGIINKEQYQERPVRYAYQLTKKGQDLSHVLMAMVAWGHKHVPGTNSPNEIKKRIK